MATGAYRRRVGVAYSRSDGIFTSEMVFAEPLEPTPAHAAGGYVDRSFASWGSTWSMKCWVGSLWPMFARTT
jgi:hypothetical protein